jgi:hypothetical protein
MPDQVRHDRPVRINFAVIEFCNLQQEYFLYGGWSPVCTLTLRLVQVLDAPVFLRYKKNILKKGIFRD